MNNFNDMTSTLQPLQHRAGVFPILQQKYNCDRFINLLTNDTHVQIKTEIFPGAIARHQLKLIVYEPITEEVIQWIN